MLKSKFKCKKCDKEVVIEVSIGLNQNKVLVKKYLNKTDEELDKKKVCNECNNTYLFSS